jgi:ubiquinone/menaquinone biosynthesis C-methylase UbiE
VTQNKLSTFDRIAAPYDRGMAPLERMALREMRTRLVPRARGRVLEIGIGTGANLPFYAPDVQLAAVDESVDMLSVAAQRASALERSVHLGQANAEHLAFPSGHFDTVVASFVLCSVLDQRQALSELWRVLHKPGGLLLLLEHMRPHVRPLAWLVDLANIPWYAFNGRCHLNRETQEALGEVGFQVDLAESRLGGLVRLLMARA